MRLTHKKHCYLLSAGREREKRVKNRIVHFTGICISTMVSFLFFMTISSMVFAVPNVPKFKVTAQYMQSVSILVEPNTTKEQLKALIYELRNARNNKALSKMLPPTTKGGKYGDYAILSVYVFSESEWATKSKLQKYMNASVNTKADISFSKNFCKHIKAYHLYSYTRKIIAQKEPGMTWEIGSIGYYEENSSYGKGACSSEYEKLF